MISRMMRRCGRHGELQISKCLKGIAALREEKNERRYDINIGPDTGYFMDIDVCDWSREQTIPIDWRVCQKLHMLILRTIPVD